MIRRVGSGYCGTADTAAKKGFVELQAVGRCGDDYFGWMLSSASSYCCDCWRLDLGMDGVWAAVGAVGDLRKPVHNFLERKEHGQNEFMFSKAASNNSFFRIGGVFIKLLSALNLKPCEIARF